MKRRIACLLICVCLLLCMALPAGAQDEGAAFTDRGRIRNVGAVQMLVDLGLISGYDDGTFRPGNFITREEVAKLVAILCTENPQAPADVYFYDAQKYFETACYMEPNSREYRNALNSIREAYTRQQQRRAQRRKQPSAALYSLVGAQRKARSRLCCHTFSSQYNSNSASRDA